VRFHLGWQGVQIATSLFTSCLRIIQGSLVEFDVGWVVMFVVPSKITRKIKKKEKEERRNQARLT